MIPFASKLHLLLVMIIVGFGVYMFLLYKEVKTFQDEIDGLKRDIMRLSAAYSVPIVDEYVAPLKEKTTEITKGQCSFRPHKKVVEQDADDASVTSIEIKDILTNICIGEEKETNIEEVVLEQPEVQTLPDDIVQDVVDNIVVPPEVLETSKIKLDVPLVDYCTLSAAELENIKCEDLRAFCKKTGLVSKGTKGQLIQIIIKQEKLTK
jgi:hypothetical protein